ncbi:MAG: LPXTG cell wall anchor domain-containing protein [Bacillota bacterium]|nr:LPXTG cell wall anchor domain-containing protein [Bacillota bacterium]
MKKQCKPAAMLIVMTLLALVLSFFQPVLALPSNNGGAQTSNEDPGFSPDSPIGSSTPESSTTTAPQGSHSVSSQYIPNDSSTPESSTTTAPQGSHSVSSQYIPNDPTTSEEEHSAPATLPDPTNPDSSWEPDHSLIVPEESQATPTTIRETPSEPVPSIDYPDLSEPGLSDGIYIPTGLKEIRIIRETPLWFMDSLEPAVFISNARVEDFICVRLNGVEVDRAHYDVREGSTIITFKHAWLKSLGVGKHQVEIVSTTGTARSMIEIKAPSSQNPVAESTASETAGTVPVTETKSTDSLPRTGRGDGQQWWLALILLLAGGVLLAVLARRITRQKK